MALSHTILAALLDEPSTGYDLAKQFGADGHFWHATHQQIYREVARLEQDELIEPVGGPGVRGDRRWRATDRGRTDLRDWALGHTKPAEIKEDILIKCLLLGVLSHDELAQLIVERRAAHSERLARYDGVKAERFPEDRALDGAALGGYLALDAGISYERAWIEWADNAIRMLKVCATDRVG